MSRPASRENATNAFPSSLMALNQATATARPLALTAGPFTGQASISQLSLCTATGVVHRPAVRRETSMSRTSFGLRLRNATMGPSEVVATEVGQHSQTRVSIATSEAACLLW